VPYEVSVGGPGDLRRPHFDTVTVSLDQQIGRNTFVELAFNHQQYHTFNQQVNSGTRVFVVSLSTGLLFQPNHTAFVPMSLLRHRMGTGASFHPDRLSAEIVTPATEPVVTSTSSSKPASARKLDSENRVMYIVFGSQCPIVR